MHFFNHINIRYNLEFDFSNLVKEKLCYASQDFKKDLDYL